jgi:hypothetical protein
MQGFKEHLGRFIEARDIELLRYNAMVGGGTTGVFQVNAKFEYGLAEVKITVFKDDNSVKLHGLHLSNYTALNDQNPGT